jgi:hypothetical protein
MHRTAAVSTSTRPSDAGLAEMTTLEPPQALFALTLAWTGARPSEVLALTPSSFQVEGRIVAFRTLEAAQAQRPRGTDPARTDGGTRSAFPDCGHAAGSTTRGSSLVAVEPGYGLADHQAPDDGVPDQGAPCLTAWPTPRLRCRHAASRRAPQFCPTLAWPCAHEHHGDLRRCLRPRGDQFCCAVLGACSIHSASYGAAKSVGGAYNAAGP